MQTHSNPVHTPQSHCRDGSGVNFVMRKPWSRGRGRAQTPGWEHRQHTPRRHGREHGRSMAVAIHADYRARSDTMKVSGGECQVPLRMEVSNGRLEGISGKDISGGLVALGKGQSLTHVCQSGKDRQSLSLCQGGVDLSALWGGGGRAQVGLKLSPFAYHYPDQG